MGNSFVQYLNVGFGFFNNTRPITEWDVNAAMEEALTADDPATDVSIIGFRFYDMDPVTNSITKRSGIYYLDGEVMTYPQIDNDVNNFIKSTNRQIEKGQRLIKIMKPGPLVYMFESDDVLVDTSPVIAKIKARKAKEQIERLKIGIEEYKHALIEELRKIENAIESNSYNMIPLSAESETVKFLNIMNDDGNFCKHIDHLRSQRVEIMTLEKEIASASGNGSPIGQY